MVSARMKLLEVGVNHAAAAGARVPLVMVQARASFGPTGEVGDEASRS